MTVSSFAKTAAIMAWAFLAAAPTEGVKLAASFRERRVMRRTGGYVGPEQREFQRQTRLGVMNTRRAMYGGQDATVSGALRFTLAWENPEGGQNHDLDLWVTTPSGKHIGYRNMQADGGALDVDKREWDLSDPVDPNIGPVENIVWTKDAPKGVYKVRVHNYAGNTDVKVPCEVSWKIGTGDEQYEIVRANGPPNSAESDNGNGTGDSWIDVATVTV